MTQQPICKKDNISVAIISGYRFAWASQFVSVISKQSGPGHGPAAILYGRRGGGVLGQLFFQMSQNMHFIQKL
jgi:hypothetical protein